MQSRRLHPNSPSPPSIPFTSTTVLALRPENNGVRINEFV
jgi:hypothetical protein